MNENSFVSKEYKEIISETMLATEMKEGAEYTINSDSFTVVTFPNNREIELPRGTKIVVSKKYERYTHFYVPEIPASFSLKNLERLPVTRE